MQSSLLFFCVALQEKNQQIQIDQDWYWILAKIEPCFIVSDCKLVTNLVYWSVNESKWVSNFQHYYQVSASVMNNKSHCPWKY